MRAIRRTGSSTQCGENYRAKYDRRFHSESLQKEPPVAGGDFALCNASARADDRKCARLRYLTVPCAARFNETRRVTDDSSTRGAPRESEPEKSEPGYDRKAGVALRADFRNVALRAGGADHGDARRFSGGGIACATDRVADACLRPRRWGDGNNRNAKAQLDDWEELFHTYTYSNIRSITVCERLRAKYSEWLHSLEADVGCLHANSRFWQRADPPPRLL